MPAKLLFFTWIVISCVSDDAKRVGYPTGTSDF
jgi:hypothetical protein